MPNDVNIPALPSIGKAGRSNIPELAWGDFLNSAYLPPRIKALMQGFLPQILQAYSIMSSHAFDGNPTTSFSDQGNGNIFSQISSPQGEGGLRPLPLFEDYLYEKSPFDYLRQFMPMMSQNSPFASLFNPSGFGGQGQRGQRGRVF